MKKINIIESFAAPLMIPNINTDIISPMRRMITQCDLGQYAFEPLRYINGDGDNGIPNPEFPLNQELYRNAHIMIVGENFGCGSSRETAPEGIAKMGIECIIGSSFGGIFFRNCFQQGILPISLPSSTIESMVKLTDKGKFRVCLEDQIIQCPDNNIYTFDIEKFRKHSLLNGLEYIESVLEHQKEIESYIQSIAVKTPWIV